MIDQHDLLTMRQARERVGVNHRTLVRLLHDGGATLYESPTDKRVLLVRRDDLDRLSKPRPIRPGEGGATSPNAAA